MSTRSTSNPDVPRQVPLFASASSTTAKTESPSKSHRANSCAADQPSDLKSAPLQQHSPAELAQQLLERICRSRRWERELTLGATDRQLQAALGNCWCSAQTIDCQFQTGAEPALRFTDSTFKIELFTMSAPQVSSHIRRIVGIPQPKSEREQEAALQAVLSEQRKSLRREILPFVRSLLGEKTPRKAKQHAPPALSEEVIDLLFREYCLTENAERKTLVKITTLLTRGGKHNTVNAAKHAIAIIESARLRWRSVEAYWLEPQSHDAK